MFPFLVEALSDENVKNQPSLTCTALELLTSLIRNVQDPFPSAYTTQVFPRIASIMLSVDQEGLLQNGQEALKLLVHRDFQGIASWSDGTNSGVHYIMKFILQLLDPNNHSESSAIYVGEYQ
jgi:hypothetical protein